MIRRKAKEPAAVFLQPGELFCSRQPSVVQTILGSCVAITMFSSRLRTGAICHAMLPSGGLKERPGEDVKGAVSAIFNKMLRHGAVVDELEVKLFGGSNVLPAVAGERESRGTIGEQNIKAALEIIELLDLSLAAFDTGGDTGRKLFFYTATGEVYVRRQRSSPAKRSYS